MMRVLFVNRFDWSTNIGGDSIQMMKTREFLTKLNVNVDITTNNLSEIANYDIIHVFNLMRPTEATIAVRKAKKHRKKIVFSSIFWDFSEFNSIGRNNNRLYKMLNFLPLFSQEKLKDFIRLKDSNIPVHTILSSLLTDYKKTLRSVDLFLPNSDSEGKQVCKFLGFDAPVLTVFNGIDAGVFNFQSANRKKIGVYCARIDPRKNHLNLFKGYSSSKIELYGKIGNLHASYHRYLNDINPGNYDFCGEVAHNNLAAQLNRADFHVMPSWLETPGLAQLEAAACGCKIISTDRGSARDYFGTYATYCNPADPTDIALKVQTARDGSVNRKELSEFIIDKFSWSVAAEQTKRAYEFVLEAKTI